MKLGISVFSDAFLASGVPIAGDPITSVENVSLLDLRTTTVLDNRNPIVSGVVKARFIATNCGPRLLELLAPAGRRDDRRNSQNNVITLLPGESFEYAAFRSWDTPGKYQLALAYEARCAGQPFARLTYPAVTIHVRLPEASWLYWPLWAGAAHARAQ